MRLGNSSFRFLIKHNWFILLASESVRVKELIMSINCMPKLLSSIYVVRANVLKVTRRGVHLSAINNNELKSYVMKAAKALDYEFPTLICDDSDGVPLPNIEDLTENDDKLVVNEKKIMIGKTSAAHKLIAMLLSKAAGVKGVFKDTEYDPAEGILRSQVTIADADRMIRTSHVLQGSLVEATPDMEHSAKIHNSINILIGDYLLSTVLNNMVKLKNRELSELVFSTQKDLADSNYIGPRTKNNEPLPCKPVPDSEYIPIPYEFSCDPIPYHSNALSNAKSEWMLRNILNGGSLLAKICQGCLMVAGHVPVTQRKAHVFGRSFALLWQASLELRQFTTDYSTEFSLVSAPILFHLQEHSEFYQEFESLEHADLCVNYNKIRYLVGLGSAIEKTTQMKAELSSQCLDVLDDFEPSKAKDVLTRLINSL